MKAFVEERERHLVARAVDDDVDLLDRAVVELHPVALELGEVRLDRDLAVGDAVEHVGGDRRVRLADLVVGLGQAVVLHGPDRDLVHRLEQQPAEREGQERGELVDADLVERAAEQVLGQDVGPAARGQEGPPGVERRLGGDVHRAVAHAEDEHALVLERLVVDVVVRVHLDAVEGAGEGGLGPARVPVVAVGHEQRVVLARVAAVEGDLPHAVIAAGGALDPRLEDDPVAEAEVVDVVVEVLRDVRVMREVGIGLRHREVRVLHALPRRVDVQEPVGRGHLVLVAEHPVPAHAVALLEAVERDAALVQDLGGGDAGRSGADDAGAGQLGHGRLPRAR